MPRVEASGGSVTEAHLLLCAGALHCTRLPSKAVLRVAPVAPRLSEETPASDPARPVPRAKAFLKPTASVDKSFVSRLLGHLSSRFTAPTCCWRLCRPASR